jgi:carboxyl-terminal processing protease
MHQTDHEELLEIFLTSMTMAYDPHSTYMSAASKEEFEIHLRLNLDGIGAQLSWQDEVTVVSNVVQGGAADRDGRLKEMDQIVGVGQGASGEIVDTVGQKLRDVVRLIRGKRGTIVRLKVIPAGKTESTVYNITRDRILPSTWTWRPTAAATRSTRARLATWPRSSKTSGPRKWTP